MSALRWAPLALLLAAVGCASPDEGAPADADVGTTHAYVTVEREGNLGDGAARARASATFLRAKDEADVATAARLVGATPISGELGCHRVADDEHVALGGLEPVELVQAGDVTITAGETRTALAARAYPDVAHLVSGVVYTSPDEVADVIPGVSTLTLHAAGSPTVAPFTIELAVPSPLRDVAADGQSLSDPDVQVAPGDVTLTWAADDETAGEVVWVDLGANEHGRTQCVAPIDGSLTLAAGDLPAGDLHLSLHRARTTAFATESALPGELAVDTAITVAVPRAAE